MIGLAQRRAVVPLLLLGLLVLALHGCGDDGDSPSAAAPAPEKPQVESAEARLRPLASSGASGTAVMTKRPKTPQGYVLAVDVHGLAPTRGENQYALWQIEDPEDRVALRSAADMVALATYRVGADRRLSVEFEPPLRAYEAVPEGRLTHFLITRIESPERLQDSIVEFDETGRPPDLGDPIAEGTFSGPLVGAAAPR